jgi:hypothetical protein
MHSLAVDEKTSNRKHQADLSGSVQGPVRHCASALPFLGAAFRCLAAQNRLAFTETRLGARAEATPVEHESKHFVWDQTN